MVFFDERIGTRQLLGIILALSSAAALSYNPGEPGIIKRGRAVAVGPGE
jgi:hypothetical protein